MVRPRRGGEGGPLAGPPIRCGLPVRNLYERRPEPGALNDMHYPRRNSKIKRRRKQGFRARMRTPGGRNIINRKRRRGNYRINLD